MKKFVLSLTDLDISMFESKRALLFLLSIIYFCFLSLQNGCIGVLWRCINDSKYCASVSVGTMSGFELKWFVAI